MNEGRATVAALSGVTLTYGKTIALDGIDLAIPAGLHGRVHRAGWRRQILAAEPGDRRAQASKRVR